METQIQNNRERSETKSQKRLLEKSFSEGDSQIPIELLVGRTDLKELSCLLLSPGLDEGGMVLESWCGCQAGTWCLQGRAWIPVPWETASDMDQNLSPAVLSNTHFWGLLPHSVQICCPSCLWGSTGTASGIWSNLSKAPLVHMGFLSWEKKIVVWP